MIEKSRGYGSGRFCGTDLMTFCPGAENRARPLGSAAVVAVRRQQGSVSGLGRPRLLKTLPLLPPPSAGPQPIGRGGAPTASLLANGAII